MSSDQREPFLARYSSDEEDQKYDTRATTMERQWSWKHAFLIHGLLILSYTIVFYILVQQHTSSKCLQPDGGTYFTQLSRTILIFLLEQYTIPVEFNSKSTVFHNLSQTAYAGEKTKEDLDAAWDDLLAPMNMRFSASELSQVNQDSIALPENGGYLGWFGVFHNLHCVKMLRHSFDRARQCNSTEEESHKDKQHVDHCIELLRQSSVCRPDTSLTTFIWDRSTNLPMFNVSESVHTCVDWDAFMDREQRRVVKEEEMDRLKNPLLNDI